jgi:hypothetical protein
MVSIEEYLNKYTHSRNETTGEYKGAEVDGKPHGKGYMKWSDGSYYDGDWANGLRHGQGTFKDQEGNTYEGQWENDYRHGSGAMTYKIDRKIDRVEGNWVRDRLEGPGKMNNFQRYIMAG